MYRFRSALVFSFALVLSSAFAANSYGDDSPSAPVSLHSDWRLESSCKLSAKAEAISLAGFDDSKWHPAIVPGTVVGSLVADKTLPDPNYGKNLNSFPGAFTDNKRQAANLDMPADSPFRCSHWFRTEFATPVAYANRAVWLHFLGINYRANIWLNGKQILEYDLGSDTLKSLVAQSKFKDYPRFARNKEGYVALQYHGDEVWYRNIRIRALPAR